MIGHHLDFTVQCKVARRRIAIYPTTVIIVAQKPERDIIEQSYPHLLYDVASTLNRSLNISQRCSIHPIPSSS